MKQFQALALRAALTYTDTVLALLIASKVTLDISIVQTVAVAALAPALSVLRNGLALLVPAVPSTLDKPVVAPTPQFTMDSAGKLTLQGGVSLPTSETKP